MLGYAEVRMNYSPKTQPKRTLLPGEMIPDSPDNQGPLGFGGPTYHKRPDLTTETPIQGDHGDQDLRQSVFTSGRPLFGFDYAKMAEDAKGTGSDTKDFREVYFTPLAQAQRLRRNVHFNLQGLTRRIAAPDTQSQTEQGYTLPLQAFAFVANQMWKSPASKNVAGSTMTAVHPTLKRPIPTASIATRMPWNSAPGQY